MSGKPLCVEGVKRDHRFKQEVDDPNSTVKNPAREIVACPIFASDDAEMNQQFPRAILLLINKLPKKLNVPKES